MTTRTDVFTWRFGGWLADLPSTVSWTILGGAAVLGLAFVLWSYRHGLTQLPRSRRVALCALRTLIWLGLMVILAAPTRVETVFEGATQRPIAVLVDRSASMTTPDHRQRRRLDDALQRWRAVESEVQFQPGAVKSFAFADGVQPVSSPVSGVSLPAGQTNFFSSLVRVLEQAPPGGWGGVVTLTDGLDTSASSSAQGCDQVAQAALAANTPLYFIAGHNRFAGKPFFNLREFVAPNEVAPRSTFRVEAHFDSYQPAPASLPLEFKVNGASRASTTFKVSSGRSLQSWFANVEAESPGELNLELHVGETVARAVVQVAPPPSNRILYFQGALDWGYRFLSDILRRDSSFVITPVFNFPNPQALLPAGALRSLPDRAELANYDIIILANASVIQFSDTQQKALSDWVRDGGNLIFLVPDDDSTEGLSGSELEKMLPVEFLPRVEKERAIETAFNRSRYRGRSSREAEAPPLDSYAWEDTPHVREIFGADTGENKIASPVFSAFAHVARAKPGAEVLARHPTALVAGTKEHAILLALQRYGSGQCAVLTTDALWRWKLQQPSTERGVELFWQRLLSWLDRGRQHGVRFDHPPFRAELNRAVDFRILGAGFEKLTVQASRDQEQTVLAEGVREGEKRVFSWKPAQPGTWEISATNAGGKRTRHWITVETTSTGELSGLPPDEDLLRSLGNRTGGGLLDQEAPTAWKTPAEEKTLVSERAQLLWHHEWLLAGLLALYCAELLLRRKYHLL